MEPELPIEYRRITAPYYNVALFKYWGDIYDSIFCYLKPFMKVKNSSNLFERIEEDDNYFDMRLLAEQTFPLSWEKMLQITGFDSIATLRQAMTTREEFSNQKDRLREICIQEKIIQPYEDSFSPHQLEALIDILKQMGHSQIRCIPEFPNIDLSYEVDLDLDKVIDQYQYRNCLQTVDERLLFANAFDYVETFICGSRSLVQRFAERLEGFYCDKETMSWWAFK